jgi:NCAIR mutase (PurE)-related protein
MSSFEHPFDAIRRELQANIGDDQGGEIRLDFGRERRTGIPEIVLGGRKPASLIVKALVRLANANGRALATRLAPGQMAEVVGLLPPDLIHFDHPIANALIVARKDAEPPCRSGKIGVITAGSSDALVAAEAVLIAREMGCRVMEAHDVGVAGLHRLVRPLEAMIAEGVHVLIVVAGMDGALPSVVAGLVPVPVIGVPTSVGYGFGGAGEGALMTMLQSCAPGLVVVNIDNGIGAGSTAALIANQAGG